MKTLLISTALFLWFAHQSTSQSLNKEWTFDAGSKVLASPVSDGERIYLGGVNGIMYALEAGTGKEVWNYDTQGTIRAAATLAGELLFFESANLFFGLEATTGKVRWKYDPEISPLFFEHEGTRYDYRIDPWDDIRSVPIVVDDIIYVGSSDGTVYGFAVETGEIISQFKSDGGSPVRSTPMVDNEIIYFGDWQGVVYAYHLSGELKWKKRTFRYDKPYPSFGPIVGGFAISNDLLVFGARNHMMNVLYLETGEREWTYIDPEAGWIVGDPVLDNDTLYIGGSDNFSMYAFSPKWGRYLWQHNGGKNIYTKPILTSDYLIYTAGDGYNWTNSGKVYLLDRMTGKQLTEYETPNGIFSSPILVNNQVVYGCHDGLVYSLGLSD